MLKIPMTISVVIAAIVMLSGCASIPYSNSLSTRNVDYPKVGVVVTAYIGDHLVEKGSITTNKALQVTQPIDSWAYDIPVGTYPQIGGDASSDFYSGIGVIKNWITDPVTGLRLGKHPSAKLCVTTPFTNSAACYIGQWHRDTVVSESGKNFQQALLYNGRVGDKLNISYREFSGGYARDAYTNSIEYDLSDSKIIGYKGAVIEVVEADNQKIVYKLIRKFK